MSESLEGIGLFIEVSTITIKIGTHMAKMNVTMQHLGITILELVIVQIVGMNQIDSFVLHLFLAWSTFTGWLHGKHHSQYQQSEDDKQVSLQRLTINFQLLPYPAFIFKLAVTIALVDTHIG